MRRWIMCLSALAASACYADIIDVGDKAPDFAIRLPDGKDTSLKGLLKNGPVLVRFAATG